jgi:hypothetical protein
VVHQSLVASALLPESCFSAAEGWRIGAAEPSDHSRTDLGELLMRRRDIIKLLGARRVTRGGSHGWRTHSITSSARAMNATGKVIPSAIALLKLTAK